jgi:D-glycero-alpha-D-manno-heptose-7-phosphate kinase
VIISRTPFRVSFFGGGTDYPSWYRENGGAVLATTINKYCYLTCRYLPPFFAYRSRILYSKVECVDDPAEIQHPGVRGVLTYLKVKEGLEVHHDGDLPARTGIGSSSTFTVGLLHAVYALRGIMPSKMQLARDAFVVEHEVLKETVGVQDQTLAAFGGFNRIDFGRNDEIQVAPVTLPRERLEQLEAHLLLVFTGFTRTASEIAADQMERAELNRSGLAEIRASVDEAGALLGDGSDLAGFGRLLHDGWRLKKSLSPRISTKAIDECYEAARGAGAIGGKILGAGGGGFMLLFAPPDRHLAILERLRLMRVPFRFERTGSQIIFYDPDSLHA